jgi:2Fe-2S ferredoxin
MPKITVLPNDEFCPEGKVIKITAGTSVCRALLDNGIEIEHACEMSNACTTCHVHVRKGFDSIEESDELEDDLLDKAWGLDPDSRLSCQAIISDEDLVIEIPKYTINQVSETST